MKAIGSGRPEPPEVERRRAFRVWFDSVEAVAAAWFVPLVWLITACGVLALCLVRG